MSFDLNTIVLVLGMFGMFILFLAFKSMRIRLLESKFLFVAVLAAFCFLLTFLLFYYELMQGDLILAEFFKKLCPAPLCTIWIAGFYYYEGMINDRPDLGRSLLFLGLFTSIMGYIIFDLFGFISIPFASTIGLVLGFWYGTSFHIFAIHVTRKILKLFQRRNIKIDYFSLILVGTSTFFVGLYYLLEVWGIPESFRLIWGGIGGVFVLTGASILGLNQYKHGDYIFNTPVPIHVVMIYGDSGQLIYSRNVHPISARPLLGDKDILISGALTAFQIFFKEILGKKTQLRRIDATDYEFFFMPLIHNEGTVVLVASGSNYFLHKSIKKFASSINEDFLKQLNDTHEIDKFNDQLDEILLTSFPFLVIDKKRQVR